jgi:hypothetical protein
MGKLGRKTKVPQEAGNANHTSGNGMLWSSMNIQSPVGYFVLKKAYDPQAKEDKQKRMAEKAIRNAQRQTAKRVRGGRPY